MCVFYTSDDEQFEMPVRIAPLRYQEYAPWNGPRLLDVAIRDIHTIFFNIFCLIMPFPMNGAQANIWLIGFAISIFSMHFFSKATSPTLVQELSRLHIFMLLLDVLHATDQFIKNIEYGKHYQTHRNLKNWSWIIEELFN